MLPHRMIHNASSLTRARCGSQHQNGAGLFGSLNRINVTNHFHSNFVGNVITYISKRGLPFVRCSILYIVRSICSGNMLHLRQDSWCQTLVAVNFHRRLNFMAAITSDKRKAEDLLKQNKSNWPAGFDIFGRAFHRNLDRKAKANKERANLRRRRRPFPGRLVRGRGFRGAKKVRGFRIV